MPFTPKFVDLVRNFTTALGTGPVTLGSAVSGYTGIAAALGTGDQFYYCIQGVDKPQEREVGRGTLQADGRVARQPISGGLTNFSTGTKTIALVAAAEWFSKLEQDAASGGSIDVATIAALAAKNVPTTAPAVLTQAGREGLFLFVPANLSAEVAGDPRQAVYVAPQSDPSGASGAWKRQISGGHNVKWFGAAGDNAANDGPAFQAAIDFLDQNLAGITGAARLFIPKGEYFLGTTTLNIRACMIIEGEGPKSSILRWANGASGIRVGRVNTPDATEGSVEAWTVGGGDMATIRMLGIKGGYPGTEAEQHGIELRARAYLSDLEIHNWPGDGIYSNATAGNPVGEGNANCAVVERVISLANRRGLFVDGADTNVWTVIGCDFRGNRTWGVDDSSFLGNTYVGCHSAANGWDGAIASIPTACTFNDKRYYVRVGQAAWCSTNTPSGTTADNQGWGFAGAGGFYNGVVEWVSGTIFREGGAYKTDNSNARNCFLGCYSEGDNNPSQMVSPSLVVGGLHGAGLIGITQLDASGSFAVVNSGPTTGAADGSLFINNTGSSSSLWFRSFNGGIATNQAAIFNSNGPSGGWLFYEALGGKHIFRLNGTQVVELTGAGMDLAAGKALSINGTQVVGTRGAAVADATDNASAITQLNALLGRLRTHGLIAT